MTEPVTPLVERLREAREYRDGLTAYDDHRLQWAIRVDELLTARNAALETQVKTMREALELYASSCDATETTPCTYEGNLCCMAARQALSPQGDAIKGDTQHD